MVLVILLILVARVVVAQVDINGQCRLDPHPSVEYLCIVPGASDDSRVCGAYEPAGTLVNPRCRRPTYYSATSLPLMRCIDGYWDYIARCTPECGRVTPNGTGLVVGGTAAMRGELPWHAGIYSTTTDPYLQICGGSLISNNVVLSAAHCFWTDLEKQLPASMFAVAVGKLYRPWNDTKDQAQKSQVKIIHLPRRYQGTSANFQDDIAVVIVAREFQFKTHIRPVCLSFDYHFEQQQLYAGNKGKVAGWGLTAADGKASPVLQVVDLPYVDVGTCIIKSPPDYREYITSDKICAGTLDREYITSDKICAGTLEREYITSDKICAGTLEPNSALCRGDSGGGLVFQERVAGVERYYLRGVVSTAPSSNRACNTAPYTSFTALSKHEPFIKQYWIESGEFKCQDGSVITVAKHCDGARDCADGSDETEHACAKTPCSDYLFRCAYGACVDRGATCDGVPDCADTSDEADELCRGPATTRDVTTRTQINECVLPPYPEHGTYSSNIAGAMPGQGYGRAVTLRLTCQRGHTAPGHTPDEEFHCFNGTWSDSLPKCVSFCRDSLNNTDADADGTSEYEFFEQVERCYKFHAQATYWPDANRTCVAEGARLAVANDLKEEAVLASLLQRHPPAAIQGTYHKLGASVGIYWDGEWMTVDGQTLEQAGRANWSPGQPQLPEQNPYALMLRDRSLANSNTYHPFAFICEKQSRVAAELHSAAEKSLDNIKYIPDIRNMAGRG